MYVLYNFINSQRAAEVKGLLETNRNYGLNDIKNAQFGPAVSWEWQVCHSVTSSPRRSSRISANTDPIDERFSGVDSGH